MRSHFICFVFVGLMLNIASIHSSLAQISKNEKYAVSNVPETSFKYYVSAGLENSPGQMGDIAPRLLSLGRHTFPVSTKNKQAQQFVNQGINLAYAFNHSEAYRAFQEAARLDSNLAMAYWGQALVLGPNINALMDPNDEVLALEMVRQAKLHIVEASIKEQALINALEKRYSGKREHRKINDKAYAEAMREVHNRFPDDPDVTMLYVESMMDLRPWNYWMPDGYPYEGTEEIVKLTEEVIRKNSKHPGALHFYIHLMESTKTPERAEIAADTLLTLMPGAGHLVHMPSHIYYRVGRYADAIKSNQLAITADEEYISQYRPQGLYPIKYHPHNIHFLYFAAVADGQSRIAIETARKVAAKVNDEALKEMPMMADFRAAPYWALARFEHWEEILNEPEPPPTNMLLRGAWHYVRGLAFVATKRLYEAEKELDAVHKILKGLSSDDQHHSDHSLHIILKVGSEVLAGEIEAARGKFDSAVAYLERAVHLEDVWLDTNLSAWHHPPRLVLAAILFESGRVVESEAVYWEDLRYHHNSGWALYGLLQTLRAQKKEHEAKLIEVRFKKAWERADVDLNSSRFWH
jgi:tetratricopeptide (TPR) repeat protein